MGCIGKTAGRRSKQSEIWESGVVVYGVPLHLLLFKVIWRSFDAFVSKWPVTGKCLAVERNWEIWTGVIVTCIWDTFDLLMFKVILESFGAIVSTFTVTRNRLAVE